MEDGSTTDRPKATRPRASRQVGAARTGGRRASVQNRPVNASADATFTVTLSIVHPDIDPALISRQLGLSPFRSMRRGEPRVTPKGAPLPGLWPDTRWNHVVFFDATQSATAAIDRWLARLEGCAAFLGKLRATGADIGLNLNLPGTAHRGESLEIATLAKAAALGVGIGIEVFPDGDSGPVAGYARSI